MLLFIAAASTSTDQGRLLNLGYLLSFHATLFRTSLVGLFITGSTEVLTCFMGRLLESIEVPIFNNNNNNNPICKAPECQKTSVASHSSETP